MVKTPQELAALDSVDVVFVLTPTESHFGYAELAMRHGKHVLVEKPVSYSRDEIAELGALAKRHDVQCVPGSSYLYLPEIRRRVRYVGEQRIGASFYLYMSEIYRMPEEYLGKYKGPVREVLCHEIHLLLASWESRVGCRGPAGSRAGTRSEQMPAEHSSALQTA